MAAISSSDAAAAVTASRDDGDIHSELLEPCRVAVIGMGAFGTAMAVLAARNGHEVRVYARKSEQRDAINNHHKNPSAKGLEDFELSDRIVAVSSVAEAVAGARVIMHALPAQVTPDFVREHRSVIPPDAIFCSTCKGLYLAKNCFLSDAILEAFDRNQAFAILSGPSFAKQILQGHPTVVVVASSALEHAVTVQRALSGLSFRIYASQDVTGVELGGALKNPLAIGAGMIEGGGYGINTMAAFLTLACGELQRLCVAMGGKPETIDGLSGIGDLMLTAFGDLSRNRACGIRLSKGETIEDICRTTTVEGVPTARVAMNFAYKCNLELPIFEAVARIIDGTIEPQDAVQRLMSRPLTVEKHH